MKQLKKLAALALSTALTCTLLPVPAFADTTNAASATATTPTEIRTIQWTNLEEQPEFAKTISVSGVEYTLASTPSIKEIKREVGKVPADHTETIECWPSDLDKTMSSFPDTWEIDTEEASGNILRESVTYTAQDALRSWEVNATQTYTSLPTNDVDQISSEISYTNPETGNTLTLALASISWEVTGYDERGRANSYTANCIYRGEDSSVVTDHYVVTATWAGEVESKTPVITYEATLTYEAPATVATPTTEPAQQTQTDWLPVAIVAVVAAGILGGFIYWHRRCDVRVGRMKGDTFRILAKTCTKRQADGSLRINLPFTIDPTKKGTALMLRKDKASGCDLTISQFGKTICTLKATEFVLLK
jgi:hypothetical protein